MAASLYNNAAKAAFTISNAGGNNSHNNLQPYITLYYIIKAKTNTYSISKVINNLDSDSSTDSLSANQGRVLNNKIDNLTTVYTGTNITAPTCEGFGKMKKLYGKTEEIGEGEKSPDNPYEINCVADDVNLFDVNDMLQGTKNGITCTLKDNILTFNGTCTQNNTTFVVVLKDTINNIKGKTNVFIEYISGTLTNQTNTTTYAFFDSSYTHNIYEKLRFENMQSISNYDDNFNFFGFQFRFDNNVVVNNYKVKVKISQKVTQTWSEYGHGETKIVSTDGTNTSNKVISCKPLCCLKDSEGSIIAQDYIDFTKLKIVRQCGYISSYNSESITTDYVSSTGSLTTGATIVYKLAEAYEEDIDTTNSIVQYSDETTISNSDNAEMEVELTKNKAISSINENIGALQEKTNLLNKTKFDLNDYIEDGITVNSSNITLVNDTVMLGLNISKPSGFVANTAVLVATLPKEIAPKVTYSASCAFHNAGSTIIAGYLTVFTDGRITVRTSTKNFSCMCNLVYNI